MTPFDIIFQMNGGLWGNDFKAAEAFRGVKFNQDAFDYLDDFQWVRENCPNITTLQIDTRFENDAVNMSFLEETRKNDWIHKIDHIRFGDDNLGDQQLFLNFCRLAREADWCLPNVTRLSISADGAYYKTIKEQKSDEDKSESESDEDESESESDEDESESESDEDESESDEKESESESETDYWGRKRKHPYSFGDDLVDFIKTCLPNLTSISLEYIVINEDGKQCIAKCIEVSTKLEAVYLARVVMEGEEDVDDPRPLTADAINTFVGSVRSQQQVFEFTYFCLQGYGYTVLLPFEDFDASTDSTASTWMHHLKVINTQIEKMNGTPEDFREGWCRLDLGRYGDILDCVLKRYDTKDFRAIPVMSVTCASRASDRKTKVCRSGTMYNEYGGESPPYYIYGIAYCCETDNEAEEDRILGSLDTLYRFDGR